MTLRTYLERQALFLRKNRSRVKDFKVFDFTYMPERPLMREEAKPLIDACLRYLTTGIANHLFIFGSRGSGKTLIVRHVGKLLAEEHRATVLYVNCRQHNTSFKILASVLGIKPRGVSLDELWERFCARYTGPLILILDEIELLSPKDRHKDILYLLSRSEQSPMTILLSNHPKFLQQLDESVRSSLQPEPIHFHNYDAPQIRRILEDRARTGLGSFAQAQLAEIAGRTAKDTNADVRVAIKTLYYAALEPKKPIRMLFDRARRDLVIDVLRNLNERHLLILQAAAVGSDPLAKAAYHRYCRLSVQHHEEPFTYMHFCNTLAYLQSIGLIVLVSTKVGRQHANQIQLFFDGEVLGAIFRARFG